MKKLFSLLIILSLLFVSPVLAKSVLDKTDKTVEVNLPLDFYNGSERKAMPNYGVNKKKVLNVMGDIESKTGYIFKTPYVDTSLKIYDYTNVLSDEEEIELRNKILEFTNESNMEVIIVFGDFSNYSDDSFRIFANDFYDYNDFGIDQDYYDGIIFVRDTVGRKDTVVTKGNGMRYYDDSRLNDIWNAQDSAVRNDEFYEMCDIFIEEAIGFYNDGLPSSMEDVIINEDGTLHYPYRFPTLVAFLVASITDLIVMLVLIAKNKMVKKATKADDYLDKKSIKYTRRDDRFISSHTSSYKISSSSGSGGGGGSSGFGGGGGSVSHR